ncbi:AAA family ATPase [Limnohabitans sp.]|uniref:AAA family ATPase n=1 Tax=Limnohabitans sp. TaxID=1907725 RepID=UPI00311F4B41
MLDSLLISNFRSLQRLEVSKLGRVNLIVGKNNTGKSSVLEALRIYAGNAQRPLLEALAREHDERFRTREAEAFEEPENMPFQDFFLGRAFPLVDGQWISIGSLTNEQERLQIQHALMEEYTDQEEVDGGETINRIRRRIVPKAEADQGTAELSQVLVIKRGDRFFPPMKLVNVRARVPAAEPWAVPCSAVPTQFISMDELADEWDRVVIAGQEEIVKAALQIIEPDLESLVFVRSDQEGTYTPSRYRRERTAMVKLKGLERPVPLNSMGDGMLRVLQLALKLFTAKGGFLLIDEFENGLHYTVQERVWALLFEVADKYDIQIFATTHSWDCIESFTKVAVGRPQTEGVLFRLGRSVRTSDKGQVIATVFDEAALANVTQADMEVR